MSDPQQVSPFDHMDSDGVLNERGVKFGAKTSVLAAGGIAISNGNGPAVVGALGVNSCQIGEGTNNTPGTIQYLDSELPLVTTPMTPGTGISTGTGTVYEATVTKVGGLIKTEILIDLTGLNSGGTAGDIIGKDGGTANCHIGQILEEVNGTVFAGRVTCLEAPAGGDPDINIYGSVDEATGAQDAAISGLTGEELLIDAGDWSNGTVLGLTAMPDDEGYMYLACGDATDADYTAGILFIELWGQ